MDKRLIVVIVLFITLVLFNRPIRRFVEQLNTESFVVGSTCDKKNRCGYNEVCINSKCLQCKPPNCK